MAGLESWWGGEMRECREEGKIHHPHISPASTLSPWNNGVSATLPPFAKLPFAFETLSKERFTAFISCHSYSSTSIQQWDIFQFFFCSFRKPVLHFFTFNDANFQFVSQFVPFRHFSLRTGWYSLISSFWSLIFKGVRLSSSTLSSQRTVLRNAVRVELLPRQSTVN